LPAGGSPAGGINSLTPGAVKDLPDPLREIIDLAYNDALTPLFLYMVPLALAAFVLLLFVKEVPLATTLERDIMSESVAEGQLLITSENPVVSPSGRSTGTRE